MSAVVGSEFAGRSCVRFGGRAGMRKPSLSRCGCGWGGMAGEGGAGQGGERWRRATAMPGASRRVGRNDTWEARRAGIAAWLWEWLMNDRRVVPPVFSLSPAALVPICTPLHPIWAFDVLAAHLQHGTPADPPFHNPHDS